MQITNAKRRKIFKWLGLLGFLGLLGLIEPTGYFFFVFFSFFIASSNCVTPDVQDEMYRENSLKACKITATIAMMFCIIMLNTLSSVDNLDIIKLIFTIGAIIIWLSQPICLYYYENKR